MSCDDDLGIKPGGFWAYLYWENMKPAKFWVYPCRGVLHTPRNNPRRRFGSKTRRGSRHIVCGNMKPAKFWVYPCRAQKHTPPNILRQGFAPKTGRVLGISLLGWVKSGAFLVYPDGEMWNPPGFWCTRVGAYCIRPEMSCAEGLGIKPAGFFMYPCRAQKHTPRNAPRRRFGCKTGRVFHVPLIGDNEIGCVFDVSV